MLEKIFHLKENHTDVKTELMAGVTTFMTMAYILAVNPQHPVRFGHGCQCGPDRHLAGIVRWHCLMALLANYPFALAPGMA